MIDFEGEVFIIKVTAKEDLLVQYLNTEKKYFNLRQYVTSANKRDKVFPESWIIGGVGKIGGVGHCNNYW